MIAETLIEEVEQGQGADPKLDSEILTALGFAANGDRHWHVDGMTIWGSSQFLTKSLDLAISLVQWKLPEWEWQTGGMRDGGAAYTARVRSSKQPARYFEGNASTPARSLLAALLRALRESDDGAPGPGA